MVTPGNRHDSPFLPELISDLKPKDVIGGGYDSKANRKSCRETGLNRYTPPLYKRKHHIVKRFNSRFKEMLGGCWLWLEGPAKKATAGTPRCSR